MESVHPILWIIGTLALYTSVWLALVMLLESVRYRSLSGVAAILLVLVPILLILRLTDLARAEKFATATCVALAGLYCVYLLGPKRIRDWKRVKQRGEYRRKVAYHLILLTGAAVFITPFVWLVSTSLKEEDQIFKYPPVWIPTRQLTIEYGGKERGVFTFVRNGSTLHAVEIADLEDGRKTVRVLPGQPGAGSEYTLELSKLTKVRRFGLKWENFTDALDTQPEETRKGLVYLWNTVYMTILAILGTLLSSSMVAYSFARLKWPGRDALFLVLISTMMLPQAVTMIPVYLIFRSLGWIDTLRPLWIPAFFGGAFGVFLLRQFFMTIPTDLEDAAKIDGCSYFGIYWRIMLPLIKPALAALTIMTFMGTWNNFMGPLIYINSPEKMPLAYALQQFQSAHGAEYGLLMAASTLVMLPVLLVFFFTQRYFIQGVTLTGIKG